MNQYIVACLMKRESGIKLFQIGANSELQAAQKLLDDVVHADIKLCETIDSLYKTCTENGIHVSVKKLIPFEERN